MTLSHYNRRDFLRELGIGAAALPFLAGLPSLRAANSSNTAALSRKRLVIMFSPNGTLPKELWPNQFGADIPLEIKSILRPLDPYREQMLLLKGVNNKIRGDGDGHMRGMSCLLTATELNPGNIQGGSDTPAGWASGLSIDQQIRNFFQSRKETRTRFGSLEFGVAVPNRADPWTRMCYAGDDKPIAPLDNPGQMFQKLYGGAQDRESIAGILDYVREDLRRATRKLSSEDRALLEEHMQLVRKLEQDIEAARNQNELTHPEPEVDPDIELVNDNTPAISRMQIDLLVNALANDMTRVASLQYMRSVGQARMRWLDVQEGHHSLSHEPDKNLKAYEKLKRINLWFAGELAYLVKRLADTPEPGRVGGNMLDHTQIIWVNELGKGNSHTLSNIPFVLIGGGAGFKTNRALDFKGVPHNRLWLSLAHAMGDEKLQSFGTEKFSVDGPLDLS
ncbi:MAG TPA: DUF1552 domain-containing protein [Verrucomicrobiales bacterium]|nr:DUF1552 domain-containing protein [Verrucomicrobiales bacterium]HIL69141.1 DUF1552 domain-containing protein [Verrucomicrobiota bacterium]